MSRSRIPGASKSRSLRNRRFAVRLISCPLLERLQDACYGLRQTHPSIKLGFARTAPFASQFIEFSLTIVFRHSPFRLYQSLLLQAIECWIERSFLYAQDIIRELLYTLRNGVTMVRTLTECAQNQKIERSLQEIDLPYRH